MFDNITQTKQTNDTAAAVRGPTYYMVITEDTADIVYGEPPANLRRLGVIHEGRAFRMGDERVIAPDCVLYGEAVPNYHNGLVAVGGIVSASPAYLLAEWEEERVKGGPCLSVGAMRDVLRNRKPTAAMFDRIKAWINF